MAQSDVVSRSTYRQDATPNDTRVPAKVPAWVALAIAVAVGQRRGGR